jgi:hypothetical protein
MVPSLSRWTATAASFPLLSGMIGTVRSCRGWSCLRRAVPGRRGRGNRTRSSRRLGQRFLNFRRSTVFLIKLFVRHDMVTIPVLFVQHHVKLPIIALGTFQFTGLGNPRVHFVCPWFLDQPLELVVVHRRMHLLLLYLFPTTVEDALNPRTQQDKCETSLDFFGRYSL